MHKEEIEMPRKALEYLNKISRYKISIGDLAKSRILEGIEREIEEKTKRDVHFHPSVLKMDMEEVKQLKTSVDNILGHLKMGGKAAKYAKVVLEKNYSVFALLKEDISDKINESLKTGRIPNSSTLAKDMDVLKRSLDRDMVRFFQSGLNRYMRDWGIITGASLYDRDAETEAKPEITGRVTHYYDNGSKISPKPPTPETKAPKVETRTGKPLGPKEQRALKGWGRDPGDPKDTSWTEERRKQALENLKRDFLKFRKMLREAINKHGYEVERIYHQTLSPTHEEIRAVVSAEAWVPEDRESGLEQLRTVRDDIRLGGVALKTGRFLSVSELESPTTVSEGKTTGKVEAPTRAAERDALATRVGKELAGELVIIPMRARMIARYVDRSIVEGLPTGENARALLSRSEARAKYDSLSSEARELLDKWINERFWNPDLYGGPRGDTPEHIINERAQLDPKNPEHREGVSNWLWQRDIAVSFVEGMKGDFESPVDRVKFVVGWFQYTFLVEEWTRQHHVYKDIQAPQYDDLRHQFAEQAASFVEVGLFESERKHFLSLGYESNDIARFIDVNRSQGFNNEQIGRALWAQEELIAHLTVMSGDARKALSEAKYDPILALVNEKFDQLCNEWKQQNPNKKLEAPKEARFRDQALNFAFDLRRSTLEDYLGKDADTSRLTDLRSETSRMRARARALHQREAAKRPQKDVKKKKITEPKPGYSM